MAEQSALVHVGTYSEAGGAGLYALYHQMPDHWLVGEAYEAAPNASFGAYSPRFDLHYLVDERDQGMLRVLRRQKTGWEALARLPTRGAHPCYVALSPGEAWLAIANYGSGSLALFPLDGETGLPGESLIRTNKGHGPVTDRQEGPHAHCAAFSPDGQWLYQADLGTDQVLAFALDSLRGLARDPEVAFAAPAGSGPRHLIFHPHLPLAYLISELASTLTVLDAADGALSPVRSVSTLPPEFDGESLGGHIGINAAGKRLYVTNRGHDSIATFALDQTGSPSLLSHTPSGGASPRFFLLLEGQGRMLVANEEGNSVTIFKVEANGVPSQCAEVTVPGPAFLFTH